MFRSFKKAFKRQLTVTQNTPVLDNLRISSPCPASWEEMLGDDRVRFCGDCQLNVYNLSAMSRSEAEDLVRQREARLCVRFYRRVDGTMITQDCPRGFRAVVDRVSRIAGTVFSALLTMAPVAAQPSMQSAPLPPGKPTDSNKPIEMSSQVRITVTDPAGAVIPSAQIDLASQKNKLSLAQTTDNNGVANFSSVRVGNYTMTVLHAGFKTFTRKLKIVRSKNEDLAIRLRPGDTYVTVGIVTDEPIIDKDSSSKQTVFTPTAMGRIVSRPAPLK